MVKCSKKEITISDSTAEFEILDMEANVGNKYSDLVVGVKNEVLCSYIFFKSFPNSFEKPKNLFFSVDVCALTSDIGILKYYLLMQQ